MWSALHHLYEIELDEVSLYLLPKDVQLTRGATQR
jgi:hypothetical protein